MTFSAYGAIDACPALDSTSLPRDSLTRVSHETTGKIAVSWGITEFPDLVLAQQRAAFAMTECTQDSFKSENCFSWWVTATFDADQGSLDEMKKVLAQIRERWPKMQIILRGGSGFCRDELMSWCMARGVDYVSGFPRNERLRAMIQAEMQQARAEDVRRGETARIFMEFECETRDSWSKARRVAAQAGQIEGKEKPPPHFQKARNAPGESAKMIDRAAANRLW